MKVADIPTLDTFSGASPGLKKLRARAPKMLEILIDQLHGIQGVSSLEELKPDQIKPLPGGNMSVDYAIQADGHWVVVKFRSAGAKAEAQALRAWHKVGADTVQVYNEGTIPQSMQTDQRVEFLVLEAARNEKGQMAEVVKKYIEDHPDQAKPLSILLGKTLAAMSHTQAGTNFGEYADMWGSDDSKTPPHTWNGYLLGYIDEHERYLLDQGASQADLDRLRERLKGLSFPKQGVYLHGDFSTRNALLVRTHPYEIIVLDPNPLIGHPSWDLATLRNNLDFARREHEQKPDREDLQRMLQMQQDIWDGVIEGYRQAGGLPVDEAQIAAAQMMQCIYLLQGRQKIDSRKGKNPEEDIHAKAVKDTLFDKMHRLEGKGEKD